jgi:hypothetical protein
MKKKHVNVNHFIIAKMFEEEMNNPLRGKVDKLLPKRNQIRLGMQLLISLLPKILSKKIICGQKHLLRIWVC